MATPPISSIVKQGSTGEKFKFMLQQLDQMILDKHEEMEEELALKEEK